MKSATQTRTQTELAAILEIGKAAISDAKRRNIIPSDWLLKLSRPPFRINPVWLESGQGVMRIPNANPSEHGLEPHNLGDPKFRLLPVASHKITPSAEGASLRADNDDPQSLCYAFSNEWLAQRGSPERLKLLRVSGDSMRPALHDNDLVLVDESQREIREGKIFAIRIDTDVVVKRVAKKPGALALISDNRDLYDPLVVDLEHDANIEIIGRVVWLARETL